jgi:hypothetical protein
MIKRPNLFRNKEAEEVPESYSSPLAAPTNEIPATESGRNYVATAVNGLGRGTKALFGLIAFVLFLFLMIHTALAGSLMFTAPVDDKPVTERAWVARGTFVGGKIDPGTIVYGSASSYAPTDFIGKAIQGYTGAPDYFMAEVIAGPVAKVETDSANKVLVNGKDSGYTGKVESAKLDDQFLAVCISGACEEGKLIIAEYKSIGGEVRGFLYPFGLETVKSSKGAEDNGSK